MDGCVVSFMEGTSSLMVFQAAMFVYQPIQSQCTISTDTGPPKHVLFFFPSDLQSPLKGFSTTNNATHHWIRVKVWQVYEIYPRHSMCMTYLPT